VVVVLLGKGPDTSRIISRTRLFDFDNFSTIITQHHGGIRAGQHQRKIEHPDILECLLKRWIHFQLIIVVRITRLRWASGLRRAQFYCRQNLIKF
jgi:hypothetical protein